MGTGIRPRCPFRFTGEPPLPWILILAYTRELADDLAMSYMSKAGAVNCLRMGLAGPQDRREPERRDGREPKSEGSKGVFSTKSAVTGEGNCLG